MSKKFLQNTNMYIASKKKIYTKFIIIFILLILATSIFLFYTKSFILESLKDSYERNISLNNKINLLKEDLKIKDNHIDQLEINNEEINSIFTKYTNAVKFKVATAEGIRDELFTKEEKILELNREINYYKFLLNAKNKNNLISIEDFNIKISESKDYINYSFLLLSNKSNLSIKGSYNLYYYTYKNNTKKIKNKNTFKLNNNKIKFKNYLKIDGKVKINKNAQLDVIFLDVKYNGKIYNHKFVIN